MVIKNPNYGNLSSPPEPIKAWVLSPGNQSQSRISRKYLEPRSREWSWTGDFLLERADLLNKSDVKAHSVNLSWQLALDKCKYRLFRLFLASKSLKMSETKCPIYEFLAFTTFKWPSFQTFLSNMELTTDELRDRSDRIVTILDSSVTRQKSTGKPLALHDD